LKVPTRALTATSKKTVAQPAEREAEEKDKEEEERAKAIEEYSKRDRPKFYE
jgi:hypothetical protein